MADKNKSKKDRGCLFALLFPVLIILAGWIHHSLLAPVISKAIFERYCRQQNISREEILHAEYPKMGIWDLVVYDAKVIYADDPNTIYSYGFGGSGLWSDDISPLYSSSSAVEKE